MEATYRIHESHLPNLTKLIEKLNKRAARVSLPGFEFETVSVEETTRIINEITGTREVLRFLNVRIAGENPMFAGWELLGTLEHTPNGAILREVPGQEIPEIYRTAEARNCDHCGKIRTRKDTYVIRNSETGETKQVGSGCIGDFLGGVDPHTMAQYLDWVREFKTASEDEEWGSSGSSIESTYLLDFVTFAVTAIREHGWVSKTRAQESGWRVTPTVDRINTAMRPTRETDKQDRLFPTPEDAAKAEATITYFREMSRDGLSNYENNLVTLYAGTSLTYRDMALVASGVSYYSNKVGQAVEAATWAPRVISQWIGQVGEKVEFTATLVSIREIGRASYHYNDDSVSFLHTFMTAEGNKVTWFGSHNRAAEQVGQVVTVRATIKKLDTYREENQTVITRATIS